MTARHTRPVRPRQLLRRLGLALALAAVIAGGLVVCATPAATDPAEVTVTPAVYAAAAAAVPYRLTPAIPDDERPVWVVAAATLASLIVCAVMAGGQMVFCRWVLPSPRRPRSGGSTGRDGPAVGRWP